MKVEGIVEERLEETNKQQHERDEDEDGDDEVDEDDDDDDRGSKGLEMEIQTLEIV